MLAQVDTRVRDLRTLARPWPRRPPVIAMRFDLPTPDFETQPFWDGCKEGRFLLRHCNACGEHHFYPRPFCPKCWSHDVTWQDASGRGQVYTFSIVRQNDLPPFPD